MTYHYREWVAGRMTDEQLRYIRELSEHPGFSAEVLLEAAKDTENPLHDLIEWDDTKAAGHYRRDQLGIIVFTIDPQTNRERRRREREIAAQFAQAIESYRTTSIKRKERKTA